MTGPSRPGSDHRQRRAPTRRREVGVDPGQILKGLHMGDHLHGSDAGYKALAGAIDLKLFK